MSCTEIESPNPSMMIARVAGKRKSVNMVVDMNPLKITPFRE